MPLECKPRPSQTSGVFTQIACWAMLERLHGHQQQGVPVRYGLATHHFHMRGSIKGSWCRTLSRPWMSSSPPGPMGVPVTAQRWLLCRRAAMTATLPRPLPTICASSRTTRHQLQNKKQFSYAGAEVSRCTLQWPNTVLCSDLMLCSRPALRRAALCWALLCWALLC